MREKHTPEMEKVLTAVAVRAGNSIEDWAFMDEPNSFRMPDDGEWFLYEIKGQREAHVMTNAKGIAQVKISKV